MRLLITGGAGFIGSALIRHLIRDSAHAVVNLDKLTYAASPEAVTPMRRTRIPRSSGRASARAVR